MTLFFLELAGAAGYLWLVQRFLCSRGGSLTGLVRETFSRKGRASVASARSQPARPVSVNIANCRAQPIGSRQDFAECLMGRFHPCMYAFGVGEVRFCCHPESKKIIAQMQKVSRIHPHPPVNRKPQPFQSPVNGVPARPHPAVVG